MANTFAITNCLFLDKTLGLVTEIPTFCGHRAIEVPAQTVQGCNGEDPARLDKWGMVLNNTVSFHPATASAPPEEQRIVYQRAATDFFKWLASNISIIPSNLNTMVGLAVADFVETIHEMSGDGPIDDGRKYRDQFILYVL